VIDIVLEFAPIGLGVLLDALELTTPIDEVLGGIIGGLFGPAGATVGATVAGLLSGLPDGAIFGTLMDLQINIPKNIFKAATSAAIRLIPEPAREQLETCGSFADEFKLYENLWD
jgi:hypothetical protein